MPHAGASANFAICIETGDYPASLERWKVYRILADDDARAHQQLRVVDESGEDYLYPARYFRIIHLPPELETLHAAGAAGRSNG